MSHDERINIRRERWGTPTRAGDRVGLPGAASGAREAGASPSQRIRDGEAPLPQVPPHRTSNEAAHASLALSPMRTLRLRLRRTAPVRPGKSFPRSLSSCRPDTNQRATASVRDALRLSPSRRRQSGVRFLPPLRGTPPSSKQGLQQGTASAAEDHRGTTAKMGKSPPLHSLAPSAAQNGQRRPTRRLPRADHALPQQGNGQCTLPQQQPRRREGGERTTVRQRTQDSPQRPDKHAVHMASVQRRGSYA